VATAPRLTVTVLAFNEQDNLGPAVAEILAELDRIDASSELVIVDDGSTDGTGAVADELCADARVRVIHHPRNLGLGGGYRTGFAEARGELVTFFPADGQFPPSIIGRFLDRIADADLVLGYLPERRGSPLGRALSWAERLAYRALLGPMPRFQGIFMIRRAVLDQLPLRSQGRGWAVVMEMILRAGRRGYRVISVPTPVRPRLSGVSKVNNARTIAANARQLLALRRLLELD
jgi:dolichol-phosphate mannosyltransferase